MKNKIPDNDFINDKALEDLWFSCTTSFSENAFDDSGIKFYNQFVRDVEKQLVPTLSKEQKKIFEFYKENVKIWHSEIAQAAFKYGYRLGAKLMLGVLDRNVKEELSPEDLETEEWGIKY